MKKTTKKTQTTAYLGLDLGGTGAKAGVFDRTGACLGFARRAYSPLQTGDGRAEVEISAIEEAARKAAAGAVRQAGAAVQAMAVASQGQTFVVLDRNGTPLHPAILWYDSRARVQARAINEALETARPAAGRPAVEDIASGAKIQWLKEHFPHAMKDAAQYLLLPDYLSYRLTGRAVSDPNTAGSTGLCAWNTESYCPSALDAVGISEDQLARIQPAGTPIGELNSPEAARWGLSSGTLLVTGTNDQYAGALGAGNCRPGILSVTTGTCLALVTLTDRQPGSLPRGLMTGRFPLRPYYHLLAYSKTAGLVLDWFRRELAPGLPAQQLESEASDTPAGCRGLSVIPHFDGAVSPRPDPEMRGVFHGLTLRHRRGDIYRAILESLAFSMRENLDFLHGHGYRIDTLRSIGGCANSKLWLQIQADAAAMPVEEPQVSEAAVLGAAMLAAYGCGDFESLQNCSRTFYRVKNVHQPDPKSSGAMDEACEKYRRICRAFHADRPED